jgi:hypothetical protein
MVVQEATQHTPASIWKITFLLHRLGASQSQGKGKHIQF